MIILLMRHGEADHNVAGKINAEPNHFSNLTPNGYKQAEKLADKIADEPIEAFFVSEFNRTKQTAEVLNRYHHVDLIVEADLNELRIGFEGEPLAEWKQARRQADNPWTFKESGAESLADGVRRADRFITNIRQLPYDTIAIVTHGFMVVAIKALLEGESVKHLYKSGDPGAQIPHDEVVRLTLE